MNALLAAEGLGKVFTLHQRGGVQLPVFGDLNLQVAGGECVVLIGRSGSGKSSLLRCLYGNYAPSRGTVRVRHDGAWVDLTAAAPRAVLDVRRRTLGYVSQFLRVIPRVAALDIVAEPLRQLGVTAEEARTRATEWLAKLNLPERLWRLPPATFSGGEQQRVNIAHGLIAAPPIVLLDEPTAALDAENRRIVIDLVRDTRDRGTAIVGIFHDEEVRRAVATREFGVEHFRL